MKPQLRSIVGLLAVLLSTLLFISPAQGSGAAQRAPSQLYLPVALGGGSVSIPETTEVLSRETLAHLTDISDDGRTLTFDEPTPDLANLDIGDVVVGDSSATAPEGFLRLVTGIDEAGGNVIVTTEQATLVDAIESGRLSFSRTFGAADITAINVADGVTLVGAADSRRPDGIHLEIKDVVLYDQDGDGATKNDQVLAHGDLEISPGLDFDFDIDRHELKMLEVVLTADETAELKIDAKLEKPFLDRRIEIARIHLGQTTVLVGYVPVVFTLEMPVTVDLDGKVSVGLNLIDVTQNANIRAGVRYESSDWDLIADFDNTFTWAAFQPKANLTFEAGLRPEIQMRLYGIAGPFVAAKPYAEFKAELLLPAAQFSWELYGGLKVPVGVELEIFSRKLAKYEGVAIDYRLLLARSNDPPYAPTDPDPPDSSTGIPVSPRLAWKSAGDPNGDPVVFSVFIEAKPGTPGNKVCDDTSNTSCDVSILQPNTTYYWQVIAEDDSNATTAGPVWQFTTAGSGQNAPPNKPSNPSPAHMAGNVMANTALGWSGGDPDGDSVTYDVLLDKGSGAPATLICNDVSATTCAPSALLWDTAYSWQVIARDQHGQTRTGDVWRFTTRPEPDGPATMDIALILDSSGSMAQNDPRRLRIAAASVFADTMLNDDQAAVVGFDTNSYVRFPLQRLGPNRSTVRSAIDSIGQSGGSTNIVAGLNTGYAQLNSAAPGPKAAVLLTDGQHNQGSWQTSSYTQYANRGWPVFTIGLGSASDEQRLREVASATGGQYYKLSDPSQLVQVYFTIQAAVTGSTVTTNSSFTLQQNQTKSTPAGITANQNAVSFVTTWPGSEVDTTLIDPNGRVITPATPQTDPLVYHAKGATYEVYRVDYPVAGQWTVETFGADLAPGGETVTVQVAQRDDVLPSGSWREVGPGSATSGGISDTAGDSVWPALATAADNSVYVAWSESVGQQAEIYVRRWTGTAWVDVGTGSAEGGGISNTPGLSELPTIDIGPDGSVYVAWQEADQGANDIYVKRWDGVSWQAFGLSTDAGGISQTNRDSQYPDLKVAPNNQVYVAWRESEASDNEIYVRRWDGASWAGVGGSDAAGGISNNAGDSGRLSLAITPQGQPYVAWTDATSGDTEIYVRRLVGATWAEVGPGSATGGGVSNNSGASRTPSLAVDSNSYVWLVWPDNSGGAFDILARRWNGNAWAPMGINNGDVSQSTGDTFAPDVAVGTNDIPYVTWFDNSPGSLEIYVRRWNGVGWEEAGTGSATGGGISSSQGASAHASVAVTPNKKAFVVWNDNTSGNFEIYMKEWSP